MLYQSTLFDIFNHPPSANNQNELDEYLAIPQIPFNTDPFSWWRVNKEKFPILSELGRAYLSVSATSTPSKRLFSDCGNLMGPKRICISPEFFKRIVFLKRNYNVLNTIHQPSSKE